MADLQYKWWGLYCRNALNTTERIISKTLPFFSLSRDNNTTIIQLFTITDDIDKHNTITYLQYLQFGQHGNSLFRCY